MPTETWREVVARRSRYEELHCKLVSGQVHEVNDLITYNLDIEQFTQDVIDSSEGPELLRAFWKALLGIKVLDPTCGSGAFLFAALNLLEPLYDSCLDRMRSLVSDMDQSAEKHRPEKYRDFRQVLLQVQQHHNERYFVLKSIIVNNLYGVDIMDEAVEICKLRLFLKLIAQVERAEDVEPLPDIDFNIRSGNTLVGFTSIDEVKKALMGRGAKTRLPFPEEEDQLNRITEEADRANRAYLQFQRQQLEKGTVTLQDKTDLRNRLNQLNHELNRALAKAYGVEPDAHDFSAWLESHQPFHWLVDFFGVMEQGGFSVIIGNPPYIEYTKIVKRYSLNGYESLPSGNLYAYVIERSFHLCLKNGRIGMIVQLPIVCTDRMKPVRLICKVNSQCLWFANFDDRPARLFDGLEHIRATILISETSSSRRGCEDIFTTKYNRWYSEQREDLFHQLDFINVARYETEGSIPKVHSDLSLSIIEKLSTNSNLGNYLINYGTNAVFYHNAPQYWVRATNFAPYFWNERDGEQISTQVKRIFFSTRQDALTVIAAINSSLFYWWFILLSDCRHLNLREIELFPFDLAIMPIALKQNLSDLSNALCIDYKKNSVRKNAKYKTTGLVAYDEFYPKYSKPIIDEIDRLLAIHYGFSEEELDFIINYDIKYRMGTSAEEVD